MAGDETLESAAWLENLLSPGDGEEAAAAETAQRLQSALGSASELPWNEALHAQLNDALQNRVIQPLQRAKLPPSQAPGGTAPQGTAPSVRGGWGSASARK